MKQGLARSFFIFGVFMLFLLFCALLFTPLHSNAISSLSPPSFVRTWSGLATPTEVVADDFGNVYVVNGDAPSVKRFDYQANPNGWEVNVSATGIAVDSQGYVYLTLDSKVQKYDLDGQLVMEWGGLGVEPGLFGQWIGRAAIDANDILYVLDPDNGRIQLFETDGTLVDVISGLSGLDIFRPVDIDIDADGSIFLLNRLGYDVDCNIAVTEILRLSSDGLLETNWGGWEAIGDEPGEMANVVGLAVSAGVVFVTDYRYAACELDETIHRMQAFDRDGNFLVEWGRQGYEFGNFSEHLGADVDPTGEYLYVADSFNQRIQQFRVDRYEPACDAEPSNPVANRDFECGTAPWRFFSNGQGRYLTSPDSYNGVWGGEVQIVKVGTNVQLYQPNIHLEPSQHYRLHFAAKSSNGRDIKVYLHKHGSPYTNYGILAKHFDLATFWQPFEFEFTTPDFDQPVDDARLRFWLAPFDVSGMTYHIDHVFLQKIEDGTPPVPPAVPLDPPVLPNGHCQAPSANIVTNHGFESGTQDWAFFIDRDGRFAVDTDAYECDHAAHVAINRAGNNVQLYQKGRSLQPNTAYSLRLAAKSTTGRKVHIFLHQHGAPYTNYGLNGAELDLTSEWQVFQLQFTTLGFDEPVSDARLRIWLAADDINKEEYWFDDVVLAEIDQISAAALIVDGAHIENQSLLEQGEFIDDMEQERVDGGDVGAEAVNINRVLRVVERSSEYNRRPAPDAPSGVQTLSLTFRNRSTMTLGDIQFVVRKLTRDNLLINADEGAAGVGGTLTVAADALGEDGLLTPGETFIVDFEIGLQQRRRFSLKLAAIGVPITEPVAGAAVGGDEPGGFDFDMDDLAFVRELYLPVMPFSR